MQLMKEYENIQKQKLDLLQWNDPTTSSLVGTILYVCFTSKFLYLDLQSLEAEAGLPLKSSSSTIEPTHCPEEEQAVLGSKEYVPEMAIADIPTTSQKKQCGVGRDTTKLLEPHEQVAVTSSEHSCANLEHQELDDDQKIQHTNSSLCIPVDTGILMGSPKSCLHSPSSCLHSPSASKSGALPSVTTPTNTKPPTACLDMSPLISNDVATCSRGSPPVGAPKPLPSPNSPDIFIVDDTALKPSSVEHIESIHSASKQACSLSTPESPSSALGCNVAQKATLPLNSANQSPGDVSKLGLTWKEEQEASAEKEIVRGETSTASIPSAGYNGKRFIRMYVCIHVCS